MNKFKSIDTLDTGILYILELASSLSVLLLAFGLIASMANVLTKGAVITNHLWMQEVWAWTQCIAIDASVAGAIIRTFQYRAQNEKIKMWLYAFLSVLLLFTAAIVSNIESIQQTLNITLNEAYAHVFIPVEVLVWARSIAIIFLILAHSLKHIDLSEYTGVSVSQVTEIPAPEEGAEPVPHAEKGSELKELPAPKPSLAAMKKREAEINKEKVSEYVASHPQAKPGEVAKALSLSLPTVRKHMR